MINQVEIEIRINKMWKEHLESARLKLLVELGEEWVDFLNDLHFSQPFLNESKKGEAEEKLQKWEIKVNFPAFLQKEAGTFTLGLYEYMPGNFTTWLVNGDRTGIFYISGDGVFKFLTSHKDLYAEDVLNTLWNDFGLREKIELSYYNKRSSPAPRSYHL